MSYRLYKGIKGGPNGPFRFLLYNIMDGKITFNMPFNSSKINYFGRNFRQRCEPYEDFERRNKTRYIFVKEFNFPKEAEHYILENHFELFL